MSCSDLLPPAPHLLGHLLPHLFSTCSSPALLDRSFPATRWQQTGFFDSCERSDQRKKLNAYNPQNATTARAVGRQKPRQSNGFLQRAGIASARR